MIAPWSEVDVARAGENRRYGFRDAMKRREKAANDSDRERLVLTMECRYCYYFAGGIAGQAFTSYECKACGAECQHPNTAVPKLCHDCAERLKACVRCGGTREWEPLPIAHKNSAAKKSPTKRGCRR